MRSLTHRLRPKDYRDLELIWQHFGYKLLKEMKVKFSWKQIDSDQLPENILELWHKKL